MPIKALVWTFIFIYKSTLGGRRAGMWRTKVLERSCSDFPMFDAATPNKIATLVY